MKKLLSLLPLSSDLAALLLRLIIGGLFFFHYGYGKVAHYNTYANMFTDIIGIGAKLSFNLVVFAEFFCGFLILTGLLTRFATVPLFITMAVAFFVAHAADPFDNKAIVLVYMLLCILIFIQGSGKYSADALIFKNKKIQKPESAGQQSNL